MDDRVLVAGLDSQAEAFRAVAALARVGIDPLLEESEEGRWLLRVAPAEMPAALDALGPVLSSAPSDPTTTPSMVHARSTTSGLVGLLWVGVGVSAIVILAMGGTLFDDVGVVILVGAIVITIAVLVRYATRR